MTFCYMPVTTLGSGDTGAVPNLKGSSWNSVATNYVPGNMGKSTETKGQFLGGTKGKLGELERFSTFNFLRVYQGEGHFKQKENLISTQRY